MSFLVQLRPLNPTPLVSLSNLMLFPSTMKSWKLIFTRPMGHNFMPILIGLMLGIRYLKNYLDTFYILFMCLIFKLFILMEFILPPLQI